MRKNKQYPREMCDTFKLANISVMKISKWKKRKLQKKKFTAIMTENFPNLIKNINLPIKNFQKTPTRINAEIHT